MGRAAGDRRPPSGGAPSDGTDERLMLAFAGGDLAAFGDLVALHRDAVVRFCRHMAGDAHTAEDAAQEAFVALFRYRGRYAPTGPVRGLLYRCARNACIDALRRRRGAPPPTGAEGWPECADPAPPLAATVEAADQAAAVRAALARITPLQREVLVLAHYRGLTYAEIGAALGVPPGTVASRAAAGYRALRRVLEEGRG